MEFFPLYFIPKNSNAPFLLRKGTVLHFGNSSLHSKIVQAILGDRECCKGFLKMWCHIFENPFPLPFLFLLYCLFSTRQRAFPSLFFWPNRSSPPRPRQAVQPAWRATPAPLFGIFLHCVQLGPACHPLLFLLLRLSPPA